MYRTRYQEDDVVTKRIHYGSTANDELIFAKEAKLLSSINQANIVTLIGVCEDPVSIVMEYLEFSFKSFGRNRSYSNLDDLLDYMSRDTTFSAFDKVGYYMARDIVTGVAHLHSLDIVYTGT